MEIKDLSKGDIFAVVRNDRKYKFIRFSLEVKPRDFFAEDVETGKETSINLQTKIRAIELVSDSVKDWFFTFGFGQPHEGCYHKITANEESARHAMTERFGDKWSMMYSAEEFKGQVEEYNLKEIK